MFRRRPTLDLRISCHRDLLALCVPFRRCPRTVVQRAERHPKQTRTGKLRRDKGAPRGLAWERPGERILFTLTGVGVEFDPSDLFYDFGGPTLRQCFGEGTEANCSSLPLFRIGVV